MRKIEQMTLVLRGRSGLLLDPVLTVAVNQESQKLCPLFSVVFEASFKASFTQRSLIVSKKIVRMRYLSLNKLR